MSEIINKFVGQIIEACEKRNKELEKLGIKDIPEIIISPYHLQSVTKLPFKQVYEAMEKDDRLIKRETTYHFGVFSVKK